MVLETRHKRAIARIIERHVSWLVGWYADEETVQEQYNNAAADIAKYLKRYGPSVARRRGKAE